MCVQSNTTTEDFPYENAFLSGEMSNVSVDVDERVYPPTDENVVSRMCKYLLDHKPIPIQANRDRSKPLINHLEPTEQEVHPEVHPNENSDFQQPNSSLSYTLPELSSLQHEASQTTQLKSTCESLSQSEAFTSTDELRSAGSSKNNAYFCGSNSSVPPVVISDSNCVTTTATSLNPYWIAELQLRMSDKEILEKGHWVNDRIIFAVFKVLRKDSRTRNLAGRQDVIPATKHNFANQEKLERFVQVINVRDNHWITLSNVRSRDGVHIYDSYVSLSRKKNVISYPINVEECACQFTDPVGFVNMYVALN